MISIDIFLQLGLNETIDVVDMDHSFDLCLIRRLNRKSKDTKTKNENLIWLTVIDNKQKGPLQCNGPFCYNQHMENQFEKSTTSKNEIAREVIMAEMIELRKEMDELVELMQDRLESTLKIIREAGELPDAETKKEEPLLVN